MPASVTSETRNRIATGADWWKEVDVIEWQGAWRDPRVDKFKKPKLLSLDNVFLSARLLFQSVPDLMERIEDRPNGTRRKADRPLVSWAEACRASSSADLYPLSRVVKPNADYQGQLDNLASLAPELRKAIRDVVSCHERRLLKISSGSRSTRLYQEPGGFQQAVSDRLKAISPAAHGHLGAGELLVFQSRGRTPEDAMLAALTQGLSRVGLRASSLTRAGSGDAGPAFPLYALEAFCFATGQAFLDAGLNDVGARAAAWVNTLPQSVLELIDQGRARLQVTGFASLYERDGLRLDEASLARARARHLEEAVRSALQAKNCRVPQDITTEGQGNPEERVFTTLQSAYNLKFLEVASRSCELAHRLEVNDEGNRWYHRMAVVRVIGTDPGQDNAELAAVSLTSPIAHAEFLQLDILGTTSWLATGWLIPGSEITDASFPGPHHALGPLSDPEAASWKKEVDDTYQAMEAVYSGITRDDKALVLAELKKLDAWARCRVEKLDNKFHHIADRIRRKLEEEQADDVIAALDEGRAAFPYNLKEGKPPIHRIPRRRPRRVS